MHIGPIVLSFNLLSIVCTSDSLEKILSALSMRVIKAISNRNLVQHLYYLLEFLAAWGKRPGCLTNMAYEWCSAISEVAGKLGQGEIPIIEPRPQLNELASSVSTQHVISLPPGFSLQFRLG